MNTIAHIKNKYGALDVISYVLAKALTSALYGITFFFILKLIAIIPFLAPLPIEQAPFFEKFWAGFLIYVIYSTIENYLHERSLARNGDQSEDEEASK